MTEKQSMDQISCIIQKIVNVCDIIIDRKRDQSSSVDILCELRNNLSLLSAFVRDKEAENSTLSTMCRISDEKLRNITKTMQIERETSSLRIASLQKIVEDIHTELSHVKRKLEVKSAWKTILDTQQSNELNDHAQATPRCSSSDLDEVAKILTWMSLAAADRSVKEDKSLSTVVATVVRDGLAATSDSLVRLMNENTSLRSRLHEVAAREIDAKEMLERSQQQSARYQMQSEDMLALVTKSDNELRRLHQAMQKKEERISELEAKIRKMEKELASSEHDSMMWQENCEMLLNAIEPHKSFSYQKGIDRVLQVSTPILRQTPSDRSTSRSRSGSGITQRSSTQQAREISPIRRDADDSNVCEVLFAEDTASLRV